MIAVQFDRKDIFDRLWRWGKKYMQHQEGPLKGYFAWSCKTDGTRNAQGPASDGELYYVTSLILLLIVGEIKRGLIILLRRKIFWIALCRKLVWIV